MDIYEAIAARRTLRDFEARPVERDLLLRVLDAGMKAPSHNHLRQWQFVLVEAADQRKRLVDGFLIERTETELRRLLEDRGMTDDRQYAMYYDAIPKQASMILGAGALVVPCFVQQGTLLDAKESLHELNAFASIWAVLENVLVAAASEGVFGVTKIISRPSETDYVRSTLGIPAEYEIPCYLAMGYPKEDAFVPKQLSIDLRERLHIDRWDGPATG